MAVNLFGNASLEWGLTAETGILVQSYDRSVGGDEKEAKNHEGEVVGVSLYNPRADHTVEGYIAGSTGIAAAAFGAALTIANVGSGNGVSAGQVICNGVDEKRVNEDYGMITARARQNPLVTA